MMFLWLPLLFLIPFAFVWMVRPESEVARCGPTHPYGHSSAGPADADPMDIARLRLARGEITPTEYEQIRRLIS
jgi:uncharacterized membrane protein